MIRDFPVRVSVPGVAVTRPRAVAPALLQHPAQERAIVNDHFAELDAYRGIAALLLVLFHTYTMTSATWGQPLYRATIDGFLCGLRLTGWFFTLSGFLLFLPFARAAIEQSGPRSARGFLVRRALRIVPLYYLFLAVMWPLRAERSIDPWQDLLRHLTFTHIFDDRYAQSIILPAWSLAVEASFYGFLALFGPLVYILCKRSRSQAMRAALITTVLAGITALSIAYKCHAFFTLGIPGDRLTVYSGPLAKADTFALGMILAVVVVRGRIRLSGWWPLGLFLGGLAAMGVLMLLRDSNDLVGISFHELSSVAFVLILASTVLGTGVPPWKRWLLHPALQHLGRISFSIYLWHELVVIVLLSGLLAVGFRPLAFPLLAVAVLVCSVGLASASYRLIERPALRLRHHFTPDGRLKRTAARGTGVMAEGRV